jgi:hypothetical protein
MTKLKWKVQILEGWMIGIQTFNSRKAASEFFDKWLQVAVNEGDLKSHEKIKWLGAD